MVRANTLCHRCLSDFSRSFISHKDVGGFYAKEDKRHFAPFLTPPSSLSFDQHPTPSSTAVDSPPNVVSPRTPASDQSTPVYTGTHLPQDADDVKTGEASKKDDEGKSMNSIEDEDADAEGEEDDGQWIPATHGGRFPPPAHQDDSFSSTLTPSSLSPAAPSAYTTTHAETSCTQSAIDDASNARHHHSNAVHIAHTDRANLPVNSIDAGSDGSQRHRQVLCEQRVRQSSNRFTQSTGRCPSRCCRRRRRHFGRVGHRQCPHRGYARGARKCGEL